MSGLPVSGALQQRAVDTATPAEMLAMYGDFSDVNGGDFVTVKATSNGQLVTALALSPLAADIESSITVEARGRQPIAVEVEASLSQRVRHMFSTLCLFEDSPEGPDPVFSPINITSIYQSNADNGAAYSAVAGTILTVVLEEPLPAGGYLSDWCHVDGLVDNRLCYPNLAIKFISYDRKTLTFGFSDEVALPSLAVAAITPPLGSAKLYFYNNMAGARNGAAWRFTGTSATQAALVTMFGANDVAISGALVGSHLSTVGSTAPQYLSAGFGQAEVKANSRFRIECTPAGTTFYDRPIDTVSNAYSLRAHRTAVKPAVQAELRPRIRAYRPRSMSRPIAKIVSISKSGSTTATLTLDVPHGLVSGMNVTVKGVRDQTNFASITTPVPVTVLSPTQLTLTLGASVTATSYGGALILANGGVDQPGIIGQAIQNAVWDAAAGTLTLTGNTNWSGLNVTDVAELYGVRDNATGADLGIDGAWEVANLSTTALTLRPVFSVTGARVSPPLAALASVACGGAVIARTMLRAHDLQVEVWSEQRVMVDGAGTDRNDKALPVRSIATVSVQGSSAIDSAFPNPVGTGLRAANATPAVMSASGDIVGALGTMVGAQVVRPNALPEAEWRYTGTLTTTADVAIQAAGGAGIKRYLTNIQFQNTNATATTLILKDGTTAMWTVSLPASMAQPLPISFDTPLQTAANAALNVACGTAGANVLMNAQGYTAP